MAPSYLFLALLILFSLNYSEVQSQKNETETVEILSDNDEVEITSKDDCTSETELNNDDKDNFGDDDNMEIKVDEKNIISKSDDDDPLIKDFRIATNDWVDTFLGSGSGLYPSSSASLMAQAANPNKSPEEQLEEIKEVASEITMAIQNEMTNLLSYALNFGEKDAADNNLRKKRSIETPMDSSQLVMKLLNHIKCNNEYQNIAIEKMMSAQQIADKFGVEFCPDPEILSDLAFAANEQAKELTSILQDACEASNSSSVIEFIPMDQKDCEINMPGNIIRDNIPYYVYSTEAPERETQTKQNTSTSHSHDRAFQPVSTIPASHVHYPDNHVGYNYYSHPHETQIPPSPVQYSYGPPVTPKPNFYDTISYDPNDFYLPYCSVDQMAYPPVYPIDTLELEPELVGEEVEETVSSRLSIVQDEEPGCATVNHVMTYTVSEKAHFRSPQIDKLPEQMQYYFLLM